MTKVQRSLISGNSTIGKATGDRKWVEIDDLILMENSLGKIAPSMPSEKLFKTAIDGTGKKVIDKQVRRGPHGEIGHGQRTFNPHTIRRWTNFMKCSRCHMEQGEGNKVELDVTLGFGSKRFVEKDGNGKEWYLDQIQTRDFKPLVLVGHDQPKKSKPLSEATIKKMLSFRLAKSECSVPGDVAVPFHIIQETIFNKSCLNCHNHQKKKGKLDLEADVSHKNLLGNSKYKDNAALVVPGKPEKSYLLDKLLAKKEIVGDIMPPEGEKLKSCEIKMIEGWIRSGAREN